MNPSATIASYCFLACFVYLMFASAAIRWMIDEKKIKELASAKLFRTTIPPREILTAFGVRIWWSRVIAIVAGLVALALSFALRDS